MTLGFRQPEKRAWEPAFQCSATRGGRSRGHGNGGQNTVRLMVEVGGVGYALPGAVGVWGPSLQVNGAARLGGLGNGGPDPHSELGGGI